MKIGYVRVIICFLAGAGLVLKVGRLAVFDTGPLCFAFPAESTLHLVLRLRGGIIEPSLQILARKYNQVCTQDPAGAGTQFSWKGLNQNEQPQQRQSEGGPSRLFQWLAPHGLRSKSGRAHFSMDRSSNVPQDRRAVQGHLGSCFLLSACGMHMSLQGHSQLGCAAAHPA